MNMGLYYMAIVITHYHGVQVLDVLTLSSLGPYCIDSHRNLLSSISKFGMKFTSRNLSQEPVGIINKNVQLFFFSSSEFLKKTRSAFCTILLELDHLPYGPCHYCKVGVMNSYWFVGNLMSWSSKCCVLVVYLSPLHGSNQSVLDICGDKVLSCVQMY